METLIAFQANHHLIDKTSQNTSEFISNFSSSTKSSSSTSSSSSYLSSPLSSLLEEDKDFFPEEKRAKSELNSIGNATGDMNILSKMSDDEKSLKLIGKESIYNSWTKSFTNSLNYLRKRSIFKSDPAIVKIDDKNSNFNTCTVKKNLKTTNSSIEIGSIDKSAPNNNTIVASKSVIYFFVNFRRQLY
jgi:hypothetical protein